jgi:uncharacterized protein (DUF58 family)
MKKAVAILIYGCILFFVISAIVGLVWALMFYILLFILLLVFGGVLFSREPEEPDHRG